MGRLVLFGTGLYLKQGQTVHERKKKQDTTSQLGTESRDTK